MKPEDQMPQGAPQDAGQVDPAMLAQMQQQIDPSQMQVDPAMLAQMQQGQQQPQDAIMERKVSITIRELLDLLGVGGQ
jgi:hypothetical protein